MGCSVSYGGGGGAVLPIWGPMRPIWSALRPMWGPVHPVWGPVLPMGGPVRPVWGTVCSIMGLVCLYKWGGDLNMGTRECGGCLYVAQSLQYNAKVFARHASVDQTHCFAHPLKGPRALYSSSYHCMHLEGSLN